MTARVALLLALLTLFACSSDALIAQADATPPAAAHVPASSPATNVTIEHHCEEQPLLPSSDAATGPDVTLQDAGAPDALAEATVDAAPDVITGASPLPPRVFVYGNSLVFGSGMTQPAITTDRFPAQLAAKLGTKWVSDLWIGRGGWPTSMLITAARHDLAVANAEPPRTRKVLVFWEGVNEMGSPYNCEAYEIMTRRRVEEGWTVVLITATPTAATADKTVDGGATAPYWPTLRHTSSLPRRRSSPG